MADWEEMKETITGLLICSIEEEYKIKLTDRDIILKNIIRTNKKSFGDLNISCYFLSKTLKDSPNNISQKVGKNIINKLEKTKNNHISEIKIIGPCVNIFLSINFFNKIIPKILEKSFPNISTDQKTKTMIEYSQPNTHKVFHVGHMRNACYGDCIIRLNKQLGNQIIACNYYGDEGAHVAKCLWLLQKKIKEKKLDLELIPKEKRAEFLGEIYTEAVELLDIETLTDLPYMGVYTAKILSKIKHPEAPQNLYIVAVDAGNFGTNTVICDGENCEVNDIVGYIPVNSNFKGVKIETKEIYGIKSNGLILSNKESKIFVLDKTKYPESKIKLGEELTNIGCKSKNKFKVSEELAKRQNEVDEVLKALEAREKSITELWIKTKDWSIYEYKVIYKWLGCHFDYDFYESEMSKESVIMINEFKKKGIFVENDGTTGVQLGNLGYCMLLKSNGSGLYATKDLALAKKKFEEFEIDKSIYIVDKTQTLHFKQVFKVLELMGYEKAKNCLHLSYAQVVLPSGKMSSRKGNIITFSKLVSILTEEINKTYLSKYVDKWSKEEIEHALHVISVATIKFGMLNHDPEKEIVFNLKEWTAIGGKNGAYLIYAYTRIRAILREVPFPPESKADYNLLSNEKKILILMDDFCKIIKSSAINNNPNILCNYLYNLAKLFSSWYEFSDNNIKNCRDENLKVTRLKFVTAISVILKKGMELLGIETLDKM